MTLRPPSVARPSGGAVGDPQKGQSKGKSGKSGKNGKGGKGQSKGKSGKSGKAGKGGKAWRSRGSMAGRNHTGRPTQDAEGDPWDGAEAAAHPDDWTAPPPAADGAEAHQPAAERPGANQADRPAPERRSPGRGVRARVAFRSPSPDGSHRVTFTRDRPRTPPQTRGGRPAAVRDGSPVVERPRPGARRGVQLRPGPRASSDEGDCGLM